MKQQPMPFQMETAKAAVTALMRRSGRGRFLVADEVGLGKTVVARSTIRMLSERAHEEGRYVYRFLFRKQS